MSDNVQVSMSAPIEVMAESGMVYAELQPEGYWSWPVRVECRRDMFVSGKSAPWVVGISHSSGGYNGDSDPIQRALNMAEAMCMAVEFAREWKERIDEFEAIYQKERELAEQGV